MIKNYYMVKMIIVMFFFIIEIKDLIMLNIIIMDKMEIFIVIMKVIPEVIGLIVEINPLIL